MVDRQSGFAVRVLETIAGRFLTEARLTNLVVNAPADPAAFDLELTAGGAPGRNATKIFRQDLGFRPVPLDGVTAAVGYKPQLPSYLPPGYRLAEVTVARQAGPTGSEGLNPPSRNVVSVSYRRGFDRIVVSTRSTGAQASSWYDPMGTGEGIIDQPRKFLVDRGALAGASAELVVTPRGTPHLWAVNDRLVVTISGDATADELTTMANSFTP